MFRRLSSLKLCVYAPLLLGLAACASKPHKFSGIPAIASPSDEETIIDDGDNSQPYYSPSGGKLLFVSQKRASHSLPQVYEKDLVGGDERRLTFQNGTTFNPKYHPKEPWIIYSSTTDELKENPPLLNFSEEKSSLPPHFQQPTEIYIHSLDGLEITRVTDRLGYDGEPQFSSDGKQLIWTRVVKNRTQVVLLNRLNKTLQVMNGLGVNPADYVSSTDKKANAWIEWDETFSISKLRFKSGKESSEINADHLVVKADLAFSPDNKFLLWSQFNALGGHFEIWVYNLESKCANMVVGSDSADRRYPVFSPDMKVLTYTLTRKDRSRIVNLPFVPPTGPCSTED